MVRPIRIEYDPAVDALANDFPGANDVASARLVRLDRDRALDHDSEGHLISIELRNVSKGVVLDGLPEPEVVRTAPDLVGPRRGAA